MNFTAYMYIQQKVSKPLIIRTTKKAEAHRVSGGTCTRPSYCRDGVEAYGCKWCSDHDICTSQSHRGEANKSGCKRLELEIIKKK